MERKKQLGSSSSSSSSSSYSSSSSFASELFGSKDSLSPSAGIFGSIFAPSAKVYPCLIASPLMAEIYCR